MIRLMMERPELPPVVMAFDQDVVVLGRGGGEAVDWALPFPDVSRVQCRFTSGAGTTFVEGLSERSATFLNRNRLTAITRVRASDEIRFGLCTIRVVGDAADGVRRAEGAGEAKVGEVKSAAGDAVRAGEAMAATAVSRSTARGGETAAAAVGSDTARVSARPAAGSDVAKVNAEAAVRTDAAKPNAAKVGAGTGTGEPAEAATRGAPVESDRGAVAEDVGDMAPIVEQAQRWELRGLPRGLLLSGAALRRGRRWLAGGRELREHGALVRRFVEASARQQRSDRWRAGSGAALLVAAALSGSAAASVLLPDLTLPAGTDGPEEALTCDPEALARADALVELAGQELDGAAVVLGMAHALEIAEQGRCRSRSRAEATLREQLAARRSRGLGEVEGPVTAMVARADGRYVAAADAKGVVQIWDVLGQQPSQPLGEGSGAVRLLDWSGDLRWLATGGSEPEVVIWDTSRWPQIDRRQTLTHDAEITALAFSADGSLLATADRRSTLRLWDMGGDASGTRVGEAPSLPGTVDRLVFDESARRLVARVGGEVRVWSVAPPGTPRRLGKSTALELDARATALTMNLAGTQIVTGDDEGQVFLWSAKSNGWRAQLVATHSAEVVAAKLVPSRNAVLSTAADRSLKLVELGATMRAASRPLARELRPLHEPPRLLAVDPSGKRALTVGSAAAPELWDIAARRGDPLATLTEQRTPVTEMAVAAKQSVVVTGGADGSLRAWDMLLDGGSAGAYTLTDHLAAIDAVALSRQGNTLASAGRDGRLRVWNVDLDGAPSPLRVIPLGETSVEKLAISDDGRWVAVASRSALTVWDTTKSDRGVDRADHSDEIRHMQFSRGGEWLVTADRGGDVLAWRMQPLGPETTPRRVQLGTGVMALAVSGEQIAVGVATAGGGADVRAWPIGEVGPASVPLWSHSSSITALAFDGGGQLLASGGSDGGVNAGEWRDGRFVAVAPYSLGEEVGSLAISRGPDGAAYVALGGGSGRVAVYEPLARGTRSRQFVAHAGTVSGVGFGASPHELLTAGRDGSLSLWHLSPTVMTADGVTKVALTGHVDAIVELQVDAAGRVAVSAGADQALRVWPLGVEGLVRVVCGVAGRELATDERARLIPDLGADRLCGDDEATGWR